MTRNKPVETNVNESASTTGETSMTTETTAPIAQVNGLDTVSTALGFVSIKQDAPARFVIQLREGKDGREECWIKHLPIETDENGFGLHGWNEHKRWTVSADGKSAEGWIMFNERNESYCKSPYATTDKQNFVYRSIGNTVNRAAGLAVDPGMTQRQVVAATISNLQRERDVETIRANSAALVNRVLAALMLKQTETVTRAEVDSVRTNETIAAIPAEMLDTFYAALSA